MFSGTSSREFNKLVAKWRPNAKTLAYDKMINSKALFRTHKKVVHGLQSNFKRIFRDVKPEELGKCIELLFKRWRELYQHNKAEIAQKKGWFDTETQRLWSDQKDMESIINARSKTRKKTILHKLVEKLEEDPDDVENVADTMLRMLILVLKAPGMVDPELKDLDQDSALDLVAHRYEAYEMDNDGYSSKSSKVGERDTRLVVYNFVKSIEWCRNATPANLSRFRESLNDFAKEIFTRLDIMKEIRAAAKSGSFDNFKKVVKRTGRKLCGVIPFSEVVDFVSPSNVRPRTALEKSLERPVKDKDRKKIWKWLVKHGAHPSNVQNPKYRTEAKTEREVLKETQSKIMTRHLSSKLSSRLDAKTPSAATERDDNDGHDDDEHVEKVETEERSRDGKTDSHDVDESAHKRRKPSLFTTVGDNVDMTSEDFEWSKTHTLEKLSSMNSSYIAPREPTFHEPATEKFSGDSSRTAKAVAKIDKVHNDDDDDDDDDDELSLPEDDDGEPVIAAPHRSLPTPKKATISAPTVSSTSSLRETEAHHKPLKENRASPTRSTYASAIESTVAKSDTPIPLSSDDDSDDEDDISMRGVGREKPNRGCCAGGDDCCVQ